MNTRPASTFRARADVLALLGVVLIGLYAAHPLREPFLPHGTDTLTHLYTIVPLDTLFQQGIFFSRWAPYRASGFGTPLFNYYAPLAYYVTQMFHLFGLDLVTAMRLALCSSLVGAAVGMYLWVRDVFDAPAGLVASVAYVCSPYMLFNAYFRGGLNEQYALLLMPWALWSLRRVAMTGHTRYFYLSALTCAGIILAHNLTTLLFLPVLWAYAVILTLSSKKASPARRLPLVGLGLGLGLSAFFWLPMLLERDAVLSELLYRGSEFDYHQNFVPLGNLFLPLAAAAPRAALPLATVGLALVGVLWLARRAPDSAQNPYGVLHFARNSEGGVWGFSKKLFLSRRWEAGLFALVAVSYTLMALPFSVGLWDLLRPLLQFLQFPQRFLGVVGVCLSFLAGGGFCALRRGLRLDLARLSTGALLAVVVGLLLLPTRVLGAVRYYPSLPELDVNFVMRKERETGNIYTTYVISFIPRSVQELAPLELLARDGPERLDADALPADVTITSDDYSPLRYTLTLFATRPFTATFNTFYFPGWKAQIDGQPVPLTPDAPYGRISTWVPAGRHHLEVWFGTKPLRLAADSASIFSVLALMVLGAARARRGK